MHHNIMLTFPNFAQYKENLYLTLNFTENADRIYRVRAAALHSKKKFPFFEGML